MKIRKRFFYILLPIIFIVNFDSVVAQRRENTANGGSISKELISEPKNTISIPDFVKYRPALKNLNFNEDVLAAQLDELKEKKAKIKLKTLIVAYLMIEKDFSERVVVIDRFINFYQGEENVYLTLFKFLNLNKTVAQSRKHEAEKTLKSIMKKKD